MSSKPAAHFEYAIDFVATYSSSRLLLPFHPIHSTFAPHSDAAATFSVLLPLLLEQGLASNVSEVRIVTLDTLAKASKVAGPAVLRPHLAPLVVTMLEALSNLEDAR